MFFLQKLPFGHAKFHNILSSRARCAVLIFFRRRKKVIRFEEY